MSSGTFQKSNSGEPERPKPRSSPQQITRPPQVTRPPPRPPPPPHIPRPPPPPHITRPPPPPQITRPPPPTQIMRPPPRRPPPPQITKPPPRPPPPPPRLPPPPQIMRPPPRRPPPPHITRPPPQPQIRPPPPPWAPRLPPPASASNSQTIKPEHMHNFERIVSRHEFKCFGCKLTGHGERYRCQSNCDMVFHNECKTFKETERRHKHVYELKSHKKIFKCDGCKEEGFGKRFRCDQCGHEFHTLCMFPKNPVYVNWLTQLPFKFHKEEKKSKKKFVCGACTNDIDGYFYHCAGYVSPSGMEDGLYLHPCCINLQHVFFAELKPPEDGTPLTNEDEQRYTLSDKVKKGKKCYLCNHKKLKNHHYQGWSYVCDGGKHCFHVYCVWEVVHESWVIANSRDVKDITGTLKKIEACKQLDKSSSSSSGELLDGMTMKILGTIVKMIISTLMGDPTFGIAHVFVLLFNN